MEKFISGFFVGLGRVFDTKVIGIFNIADLFMVFNVTFGIWRGWGDGGNSLIAWALVGWLWLCLKFAEMDKGRDEESAELLNDASELMQHAASTIETQQETIRELKAQLEAQQPKT